MTRYDVFKNATQTQLAVLLTSLVAGLLDEPTKEEIADYYEVIREFLDEEA